MRSYISLLWGWSIYINYLEFIMGDSSLLPHYLFIKSFISVLTHGYLLYTLGYNSILIYLLLAQIVPALAVGGSFSWPLCLFHIHPCVHLFAWAIPYFLLQDAPGSCMFSALALEIATSLRIPSSFLWRIRNQDLDTRCAYYYWGAFLMA